MARKFRAQVELTAQDRASGDIKRVESSFTRLGRSLRLGVVAGAAAAAVAFATLTRAVRAAVSAAREQEDAIAKLNAALAPLGDGAAAVSDSLQAQASALQQLTKAGDETIISGQALIASFTKNEEEIKKATAAALDLSAATGQNLQSAFLLLGRAASGETSTLSRYGITLDENIPKSEKFAAAIEKINAQFGGQAAAQAKTFSGVVTQVGNAYGDLAEQAGFAVTENEELLTALSTIRDVLLNGQTIKAIRDTADAVVDLVVGLSGLQGVEGDEAVERISAAVFDLSAKFRVLVDSTSVVLNGLQALAKVGILDFAGAAKDAEEAIEAFNRESNRLKDSIVELNPALFEAERSFEDAGTAAKGSAQKFTESADEVKGLAAAYEAAAGSAKLFGEVTSIQLESEILGIRTALADQATLLGKNSDEYVRLESVAGEKIQRLTERIEGLRDGLGDLDATAATDRLAEGFDAAASGADRLAGSVRAQQREIEIIAGAWTRYNGVIVDTTIEFDRLAESAGRATAAARAIEGGARTINSGNRIRLPGGGSRFVDEPGLSSFSQLSRTGTFSVRNIR